MAPSLASSALRASKVCLVSCLIYPVAWACHIWAVLALPVHVTLALVRTLGGVTGRGVDELLASYFHGLLGMPQNDRQLLQGLREAHNVAVGALRDQLEDSDSRYKAVYEKLRESERMRHKLQVRLAATREELAAARGEPSAGEVPGSPVSPGGWRGKGSDGDDRGAGDGDKVPVYFTTMLCIISLLYFYDVPEVPAFDRKLAMMAPGAWMTVLGAKHPALNKVLILGNLVFFGYLLHILVAHRREQAGVVGASPSSALGGLGGL